MRFEISVYDDLDDNDNLRDSINQWGYAYFAEPQYNSSIKDIEFKGQPALGVRDQKNNVFAFIINHPNQPLIIKLTCIYYDEEFEAVCRDVFDSLSFTK